MEPVAAALQAVVEAVAERALIMVDPNCRPTFIEDRDAYRRGLAATLRYAHVVKVSGDDLEYLTPGRVAGRGRARAAGRRAVGRARHARRRRRADRHRRRRGCSVAAPKITVVDTIGAGDAFGGGFLAYWSRAGSRAMRWPTRRPCGRRRSSPASSPPARVSEPGASPPRLSDLDGDL